MFSILMFVTMTAIGLCGARSEILEQLEKRYGETIAASAVVNNGYLLEVIVSPETKTWTILVTQPMGLTCLMSSGDGWQNYPLAPGGNDA